METAFDENEVEVSATDDNPHFRLVIIGKPIAWMRPEFISGINKHTVKFYWNVTVKKNLKTKTAFFQSVVKTQLQHCELPCIQSRRILVTIWFCTRPSTTFFLRSDRLELKSKYLRFAVANKAPFSQIEKPDIDNMVKFVLDALKGIGWADDDQVAVITAFKCIDLIPPFEGCTLVEFKKLVAESDLKPIPGWGRCANHP